MLKRAVIFTAVVVFGVMVTFTFAQEIETNPDVPSGEAAKKNEAQKAKVDKLAQDLNLTEEQQVQVGEIFAKNEMLIEDIVAQTRASIAQVKNKRGNDIEAILTEEQKIIFEKQEPAGRHGALIESLEAAKE